MKNRWSILLILILIIGTGIYFLIIKANKTSLLIDDETAIQQGLKERKTEAVFCTSTVPSRCFLYKCSTGYIYTISLPMQGSNPLRCTDGSGIESVKEVSYPD